MVESAHYEKDYWYFKEKEDLEAFLINLPESADRNLRLKLHPDWHDVTPEQRTAYFAQDDLLFRAMAAEKLKNGTAQSFNMDLEGKHGPYEPQRIIHRTAEAPQARLERQLADIKAVEAAKSRAAGYPIEPGEWPRGLTEAGKLRVLEGEFDWEGVSDREKEAVLAREVDFGKISRDQLNFVYEDIAFDGKEEVDERPARRLFDEANYAKAVSSAGQTSFEAQLDQARSTTRNLIEAMALDSWPRAAAVVDFGIEDQRHYEALYYPIRNDEIAPAVLDAAMGHGAKLTELVRNAPSNPHKDIVFHTDWDGLLGRPRPDGQERGGGDGPGEVSHPEEAHNAAPAAKETAAKDQRLPSPSRIIADPSPYLPETQPGHGNDRER